MRVSPTAVKLLLVIAALAALAYVTYAQLQLFLASNDVVDQGSRGLVVIGTDGGDRKYTLEVKNTVQLDGSLVLRFLISASGVKYEEPGTVFDVNVEVAFVGDHMEGARCGGSKRSLYKAEVEDLSSGLANAVYLDADGGRDSATNFNDLKGDRFRESVGQFDAHVYRSALALTRSEENYARRTVSDDGTIWVDECTIPKSAIWRTPAHSNFLSGKPRTLLLPQINWTSIGETTDYQNVLTVYNRVERAPGTVLTESYPPMTVGSNAWEAKASVYWTGRLHEPFDVGYTAQSVHIFNDRDLSDDRAVYLTLAGTLLGFIGTLVGLVVSRLVDLALPAERRTNTPT